MRTACSSTESIQASRVMAVTSAARLGGCSPGRIQLPTQSHANAARTGSSVRGPQCQARRPAGPLRWRRLAYCRSPCQRSRRSRGTWSSMCQARLHADCSIAYATCAGEQTGCFEAQPGLGDRIGSFAAARVASCNLRCQSRRRSSWNTAQRGRHMACPVSCMCFAAKQLVFQQELHVLWP